MRAALLLAALLAAAPALARDGAPETLPAQGTVEVLFTPGDPAAERIRAVIAAARKEILVQAYAFTDKAIADALIEARARGLRVMVLADFDQTYDLGASVVHRLAEAGVPVWLDVHHDAAHNKILLADPGGPAATVLSGSYNFTNAAQHRNAENLLVLRGNQALAEAYAANWRRHQRHCIPLKVRAKSP